MKSENQPKKWNLKYFSPEGEKYSGAMIITDSAVIFRQKQFKTKSALSFYISKEEISSVSEKKSLIKKEICISANGKNYIFTRTMLKTRKKNKQKKKITKI